MEKSVTEENAAEESIAEESVAEENIEENIIEEEESIDPALYNTIVHIMDDEILFVTDAEANAAIGDFYELLRDEKENGLAIVKEVRQSYAVARVIFSDEDPVPGDGVRGVSRALLEGTFYGGSFLKDNFSNSYMPTAGVRLVLARWFYYTRPALEIGTVFARAHPDLKFSNTIPVNIMAGAEITNMYFWRFQLALVMLAGLGWTHFDSESAQTFHVGSGFHLSHVTGKAFVSLSCLLFRHVKITADAGILALVDNWTTFTDVNETGYFGRKVAPFVNFGLTLR
jgi:hypothetical protein